MIALDTNILVYSHRPDSQWFMAANSCVRGLGEDSKQWGIPWPCIHEFLATVTHPRIYKPHTPVDVAIEQVDIWLESPTLQMLGESPGYWQILRANVKAGRIAGGMIHDARIASICQVHSVKEFWTADRDFSRFPALKTKNPLI